MAKIGLVGMPCAGKGEAAKVAEKRLGINEGPLTLTKTGSLLREREGPDAVAKRVAAKIRKVRLRRALSRKRRDDPKTMAELSRKDRIEKSWGATEALSKSDILIDNDRDLPHFRRHVASTIKKIFFGHG